MYDGSGPTYRGPGPGDRRRDGPETGGRAIDAAGLVGRRLRARRLLLVAVAATTLLALTAVTATALLLSATGRGSVGAALERSPAADRVVDVSGELDVPDVPDGAVGAEEAATRVAAADAAVRALLADALGPELGPALDPATGAEVVTRRVRSSTYLLPGPTDGDRRRLAVLGGYEDLTDHAALVTGRWPADVATTDVAAVRAGDAPLEVAVHERAADDLGLAPGDTVRLANTLDDSRATARVTGTFRPTEVGSPYWALDPQGVTGIDVGTSFVTYGPFVGGAGVEAVVSDPILTWRADPVLGTATPAAVDAARDGLARLQDEDAGTTTDAATALAGGDPSGAPDVTGATGAELTVETDLDETLADVAAPVAVARSAVALPLALVALLGGTALLLVTRLVQEDRRADAALRASRGFSAWQLRAGHALEALVVVLPGVLLAPVLARLTVEVVTRVAGAGAVAGSVVLEPGTWVVSLVAGLVAAALLTRQPTAAARGRVAATWSRVGLDLVAVPLAVVGTLQLLAYDPADLAAGADDALAGVGVDPVLALVVPVVVLAAALLLGRAVRGVLALAASAAARASDAVRALAAWQLARRPDEHRSLLVASVLASAVVAVAAVQATTYDDAQRDQAELAVGPDLRVSGLRDPDQAEAVVALVREAGGEAVVVTRERTALGDLPVDVLALDLAAPATSAVLGTAPDGAGGVLGDTALPALPAPSGDAATSDPLPAVASESVGARAGEAGRVRLRVAGTDLALAVSATVTAVPGTGPEADSLAAGAGAGRTATGTGLVLDRDALERSVGPAALGTDTETEVWAAVPRGAVADVRASATELADDLVVADRWSATSARQDGPVGGGVRSALLLAVVGAAVLGAVGFLAATTVGLRRRRTESAALRATGMSRSQVARSLVLERLGLLAAALLLGGGLGCVVAVLLGPRLVLTETAVAPVPAVASGLDLATVGVVAAVLAAVLVSCALAVRVGVGRLVARPVGDELRAGEDT